MTTFTLNAGSISGATAIDELSYQVEETPENTGGTATQVTEGDTTYTRTVLSGVANNFKITGNFKDLVNNTPSVCNVTNGVVQMTTNGLAKLTLKNDYCVREMSRQMSSSGATLRSFLGFNSSTLRATLYQQMLDALSVMGGVKNINLQKASVNTSAPYGGPNPNNFLTQSRLSYIAPPLDLLGQMLDCRDTEPNIGWRAWLTPHHYLTWRGHGVRDDINFKQIGGEIVVAYSPTAWTGALCKLMPSNYKDFAPGNSLFADIPCYTRFRNAYLDNFSNDAYMLVQPTFWREVFNQTPQAFKTYQYRNYQDYLATGGDSGSPIFTILNGQIIPLGHVAYAGVVGHIAYADVLTEIQSIITSFNASGLYTLQTVDLSGFTNFTATNLTPLSGTAFTYAQLSTALTGRIDSTTNATLHLAEKRTGSGIYGTTSLCLVIKGTGATLNATPVVGGASQIRVQVDGYTQTTAANASGVYTLFSGLADTEHTVLINIQNNFQNDQIGLLKSGTILNITGGADTYVIVPTRRLSETLGDTDYAYRAFTVAGQAGMVPTTLSLHNNGSPYSGSGGGSSGCIQVRSNARKACIVSRSRCFYYSVDGGKPIKVDTGIAADQQYPRSVWVDLDGLTHTYTFTGAHYSYNFWVQLYGGTVTPITRNRLDQFGDSITAGVDQGGTAYSTFGEPEVLWVANRLGFVGRNFGSGGENVSDLNTRLTSLLPLMTVTSSDVAVVASGRNGGTQADYQNVINKLITKGYGKIIVRSVLPIGTGSNFSTVQAAVNAIGNPSVIALDTSSWVGVSSNDGTHPDFNGYKQLYDFAGPAYASALNLDW